MPVDQAIIDKLALHRNAILFHTYTTYDGISSSYCAWHFYARQEGDKVYFITSRVEHINNCLQWNHELRRNENIGPKTCKTSKIIGYLSLATNHFHFNSPYMVTYEEKRRGYVKDPAIKKIFDDGTWLNILTERNWKPSPIPPSYVLFFNCVKEMLFDKAIEESISV